MRGLWGAGVDVLQKLMQPALHGHVVLQRVRKSSVPESVWEALPQGLLCSKVVREAQVAPHDVLQEANRRLLNCHRDTAL